MNRICTKNEIEEILKQIFFDLRLFKDSEIEFYTKGYLNGLCDYNIISPKLKFVGLEYLKQYLENGGLDE